MRIKERHVNVYNYSWSKTKVGYVKAPLQPGGTECGNCVMRFMKELTLDSTLMINNFYVKHMYSQEELDDIRVEWGLHFSKILAETENYVYYTGLHHEEADWKGRA